MVTSFGMSWAGAAGATTVIKAAAARSFLIVFNTTGRLSLHKGALKGCTRSPARRGYCCLAGSYGYLRSNAQIMVVTQPCIEIVPVNPDYIVVPYYDPLIVFAPPRRGIVAGAAIRFGYGVTLGAAFVPWGWHATHFGWRDHAVIINNAPWRRTWANRPVYAHPYTVPRYAGPAMEQHRTVARSARERETERSGRGIREEHHESTRRKSVCESYDET